jgi:hypothetical protein
MDRRTENRLIGALGAVAVAGLIVMAAVSAIALTSGHSDHNTVAVVATPTPSPNLPQAQKNLAFSRTTTPTTAPSPIGVPCRGDQLVAAQSGENAATGGQLFVYVAIANDSDSPCDLPPIVSLEEYGDSGQLLATRSPSVLSCNSGPFCIYRQAAAFEANCPDTGVSPANRRDGLCDHWIRYAMLVSA